MTVLSDFGLRAKVFHSKRAGSSKTAAIIGSVAAIFFFSPASATSYLFDGTYTSTVLMNGYTHTETDVVTGLDVTGSHIFTGPTTGSFNWTGVISLTSPFSGSISGSGTINNIGVRPFTLTSGGLYESAPLQFTLFWGGNDPVFGGIGGSGTYTVSASSSVPTAALSINGREVVDSFASIGATYALSFVVPNGQTDYLDYGLSSGTFDVQYCSNVSNCSSTTIKPPGGDIAFVPGNWTVYVTLTSFADPQGGFELSSTPLSVPAPTPLPAALPLFATGLGALGFLGWRRKRKTANAA